MATKKKEPTFAEAFGELEAITEALEKGVDLDEGITKFERGLELAAMLKKRLVTAENKIETIKEKYEDNGDEIEED